MKAIATFYPSPVSQFSSSFLHYRDKALKTPDVSSALSDKEEKGTKYMGRPFNLTYTL